MLQFIQPDLTDEQRANLEKLANYLESPDNHFRFSMKLFLGKKVPTPDINELSAYEMNNYSPEEVRENPHPCGSIGCAIGHGPAAGIPFPDDLGTWSGYAVRAFGAIISSHELPPRALWHWCFSDEWADVDNTPKGAAARIRLVLSKGIPVKFMPSWYRLNPLPYDTREA